MRPDRKDKIVAHAMRHAPCCTAARFGVSRQWVHRILVDRRALEARQSDQTTREVEALLRTAGVYVLVRKLRADLRRTCRYVEVQFLHRQGWTLAEIAEARGSSAGAAAVLIARARSAGLSIPRRRHPGVLARWRAAARRLGRFTAYELAEAAGRSQSTAHRWINAQGLPVVGAEQSQGPAAKVYQWVEGPSLG